MENTLHQHECPDCGDLFDCDDEECEVDTLGNGSPVLCPDCDPDETDLLDEPYEDIEEEDTYE